MSSEVFRGSIQPLLSRTGRCHSVLQSKQSIGGETLDRTQILQALRAERQRIEQAIAALEGTRRAPSRPRSLDESPLKPKRRMSAAAKKKISVANKKRWAAWRKENA